MKMKSLALACSLVLFASASSFSQTQDSQWRKLDPENTVLMTLPQGKVVIELAPQFAPNHVKQFKTLVKKGFYDGEKFYRVIDGFVAQGGPEDASEKDKSVAPLKIEGDFAVDNKWSFTLVQNNDLFAPQTGFKDGFALGYSPKEQKAWLLHCPGVIAMARENEPDTATSHFYIPNGQAPRYLDRIMTVFGRVVYGMNHVQSITRTSVIEGATEVDKKDYTPMVKVQLMTDVPVAQRLNLEVKNTEHPTYAEKLAERKQRDHTFFYKKPPQVLDICQTPVGVRIAQ
ncbi:peptidyl-prolyl cis-trans isomerase [Thalassotalea insulae]|uniref:peptidylprolyl isomerase n=1 Tax=Thalassotalea insulae TaxID=2056778 RepID=A0ABQ6GR23_9GAMM|nr:peptidylprolyl isomerase [Thalassotalea insulae]GLX78356.1 peptidyl-prolyl cis-trans isomerase [Thalassotalea insulae]